MVSSGGSSQPWPAFATLTYSRGAQSSENNSPFKASFSIFNHVDFWFCLWMYREIYFLSAHLHSALCGGLRKHGCRFIYLDSNHKPEQTPPPPLPPLGLKSGDQSGIKFDDLRPEMFRASVQIPGEHRGDGHDAAQWRHSLLYFACAAFSSCRRLQAAGCGAGVVSEPCIQMMSFRSGLRLCVVYSHLTVIPQLDRNLCHLCV